MTRYAPHFAGSLAHSQFCHGRKPDRLGATGVHYQSANIIHVLPCRLVEARLRDIVEADDGLDVRPSAHHLVGGRVGTHHDHRLALGLGLQGTPSVLVDGKQVTDTSWNGVKKAIDAALAAAPKAGS